jgi:hypothetical protein
VSLEERIAVLMARADAAVDALADVMRTLQHVAGSPEEQRVYARAREVLAESGRVKHAETAEMHAAFAEWERRKGTP